MNDTHLRNFGVPIDSTNHDRTPPYREILESKIEDKSLETRLSLILGPENTPLRTVHPSPFSLVFHQVSYPRVSGALHGSAGQMHEQALRTEDTPSAPADAASTITTGLLAVDGRETHADIPGENSKLMIHSKSVPASAVNRRRNLQESQASTCETLVKVTSSIFPLLEGCLAPSVVDGFDVAYVSSTGFVGYGEPTIITVEGYDIGVRT